MVCLRGPRLRRGVGNDEGELSTSNMELRTKHWGLCTRACIGVREAPRAQWRGKHKAIAGRRRWVLCWGGHLQASQGRGLGILVRRSGTVVLYIRSLGQKLWLALFLVGILATGCQNLATPEHTPEVATAGPEEVLVDRITYVDSQGDLFTISPDGTDRRRLTGESLVGRDVSGGPLARSLQPANIYAWPTWSPDGTKIAVSQLQAVNNETVISLQVIDLIDGRVATVYTNEEFRLVAAGAPHYTYWSPDNRFLGFLIAGRLGLTLLVEDTGNPTVPVEVETNAPLYFQWAPDGESMVMHAGDAIQLVRKPFDTSTPLLMARSQGFRVPALSPDGTLVAYTMDEPQEEGRATEHAFLIGQVGTEHRARRVLQVGSHSAFLWSPDGSELAVADRRDLESPFFERLRVVSADGATVRTIVEEQVIAFYWSPAGDKIAWVSLVPEERLFEWAVASRSGDSVKRVFRFQPSADVLAMLSFFDQYAYSHSPWSPDSTRLVVAGTQEASLGGRNGQSPSGERVFVLDVSGATPAKEIAAGTLAFWSWN